jgi:hypothetical protein
VLSKLISSSTKAEKHYPRSSQYHPGQRSDAQFFIKNTLETPKVDYKDYVSSREGVVAHDDPQV